MVIAETLTVSFLETAKPLASCVAFKHAQQISLTVPYDARRSAPVPSSDRLIWEYRPRYESPSLGLRAEEKTLSDRAVKQLLSFHDFEQNWDGNGSEKPLRTSIDDARLFVRRLLPESIIPKPTLHADGHAMLFLKQDDLYVELEFLEEQQIGYYGKRGDKEWSNQVHFDGSSLPSDLSEIGFKISS